LGWIYLQTGKHDEALAEGRKAVAAAPSSAFANFQLGAFLAWADQSEEAILVLKNASRLNPFPDDWQLISFGWAYFIAGRYEEALGYFKKAQKRNPDNIWPYYYQAALYGHLGRQEEARAAAKELLRLNPKFSIEQAEKWPGCKNKVKWNLLMNGLRKAGLPEFSRLKLPDKPSIAVLPFDNLSKDPEQEYFADGMTDDLITDLSKISGLFVIARNSTFQYKGKAVDVKKVSRELGIRYVLEGSVRRVEDKVRINAQLIDATTGGHLWAERYDGQMEDIFSLQDKITQKIVAALAVRLTSDEKENIASKGTENIAAYDAFLKGWQHYLQWTPEDVATAIEYYKKAIELDPDYYHTYAALALIYDRGARGDKEWAKALQADYFTGRAKARQFLNAAMKKPTALAYMVASWMDLRRRRYDEALREIEKATSISPNDAEVQLAMARILVYTGKPEEALDVINKVMLLDPNRMAECLHLLGIAYFCMEQHEQAISSFERVLNYNPNFQVEHWLAITYADFGHQKEAEDAFKRYQKKWFESLGLTSIGTYTKLDIQPQVFNNPFRDPEVTKRFVEGLIKAGHPKPHRYYEVSEENKLTGDEIRRLVFGRTGVGATVAGGSWTVKNGKDGSAFYEGYGLKDRGRNWIEGDQLCDQYKIFLGGLKKCQELYRNPKGTPEGKNEFLWINDTAILPVSFVD
jgi:TolB-like protein/Flp pilus assembly protein TadD